MTCIHSPNAHHILPRYAASGLCSNAVVQGVNQASVHVHAQKDNVAGVQLPVFECIIDGSAGHELTGLSRGGQKIASCKATWAKAVELLVELASLQVGDRQREETAGLRCIAAVGCPSFQTPSHGRAKLRQRWVAALSFANCVYHRRLLSRSTR